MKPSRYITSHIITTYLVFITIKTTQSRPSSASTTNTGDQVEHIPPFTSVSSILNLNHHQQQQDEFSPKPPNIHYQQFNKQMNTFLQVHKISPTSNNITCNDGSQVGYYMRLNNHSKSWIIYLQGGGFCASEESCQHRWQRSPHLMSSNYWPKTKTVDGILSSDPKENPYLWNANHIYVPYCSSDSWTGLAPANQQQQQHQRRRQFENENGETNGRNSFAFMGSKILERVLESLYEDLPRESSLYEAKFILLAGDSAGATGVIMNLDKVNSIVEHKANALLTNCSLNASSNTPYDQPANNCDQPKQSPVLRGLADSGWFLDNEPYDFGRSEPYTTATAATSITGDQDANASVGDCDHYRCTPLQSIRQAMRLWNGQVPTNCAARHPAEPWRCYFGYRAYQTLKTPLFVVQWLYDEAQLMVDNIARPDTSGQWNYVNKVVNEMRASLENVTALFAPSCFSHSLVVRRSWNQISINGFKLPHVLNSWEEQSLLDTSSSPAIATTTTYTKQLRADEGTRFMGANLVASNDSPIERQREFSSVLPQINVSLSSLVNQPTFETLLVEPESLSISSGGSSNIVPMYMRDTTSFTTITTTDRPQQELRHIIHHKPTTNNSGNANRSRTRKRKQRNNQQQRSKQARQKSVPSTVENAYQSPTTTTTTTTTESTIPVQIITKESNDLSSSANPLEDLLPLIDRSLASADLLFGRLDRESTSAGGIGNGRLGRSTLVDDATLMLSNSVPDDNSASQMSSSQTTFEHRTNSKWTWSGDSRTHPVTYGSGLISPNKSSNTDRFRLIDSCGWPQCNRDCPVLDSDFNSGGLIQI